MTLLHNEFRKLLGGRIVLLLLILLLIADAITCIFLTKPAETSADEDAHLAELAEKYYRTDPEGTKAYYLEMSAQMDRYIAELNAYSMSIVGSSRPGRPGSAEQEEADVPDPPVEPIFLYTYTQEEDDYRLLSRYFSKVEDTVNYSAQLQKVITSITRTLEYLETFDGYEDTYAYREQREMLSTYLMLMRDYTPSLSIVKGWDSLFAYQEGSIFLLLALLVVGCQIVLPDYTGQMNPVIRATKRGRFPTALAKTAVGGMAALPVALCFELVEIAVIAARQGLSSPFASIQNIEGYLYSPYPISIFTGLVVQLLLKWLAGALFLLSVAVLARLLCRPIPAYVGGLAVFTVHILLHFFKTHAEFLSLNVFSLASGLSEIKQATYFNVFGYPMEKLSTMALFCGILLLLMAAAYLLIATLHRGQPIRAPLLLKRKEKHTESTQEKQSALSARTRKLRNYPMSLFLFEGMKHIRARTVILVGIIAIAQLYSTWSTFADPLTVNEKLWESYQMQYEGELTPETAAEIRELSLYYELLRSESTVIELDESSSGEHDFENAILRFDSIETYMKEYNLAYLRQPVVTRLSEQVNYLEAKESETDVRGWLMKDTGLLRMMGQPMNVGLYLILLLILSDLFGYEGRFAPIQRISKQGRVPTWKAKFGFAALTSVGFALLFAAVDWIAFLGNFDLADTAAPLFSLQAYENVTSTITVGQYLLLLTVLRVIAAPLFGMLIAGLAGCLSSARLTLLTAGSLTLLPLALYYCGIDFCRYLDFTKLLSGDALWRLSWEGGGVGLLIGFVSVVTALSAGLVTASHRKFCK